MLLGSRIDHPRDYKVYSADGPEGSLGLLVTGSYEKIDIYIIVSRSFWESKERS